MTSLLDIAPAAEKVPIGALVIECPGISVGSLVLLLKRFPSLKDAIFSRMQSEELSDTTAAHSLMEDAPDAIAAIIAAGTGNGGDAKHEAAAARLPVEVQFDLLVGILKATMPSGVGPFAVKLLNYFGAVSSSFANLPQIAPAAVVDHPLPNGKAPATPSRLPSSG